MPDLTELPWRTGRTLGRTMYARTGGNDWKADTPVGMLDTRELAEAACAAHNAELARKAAEGGAAKPPAIQLLEEALFLRMNGEYAPGGGENWHDWDSRAEVFLRGLLPPEAEGSAP